MSRSRRRDTQIFSMSFLDVVSCGFGAVILLLVLALSLEPVTVKRVTEGLRFDVAESTAARKKHDRETELLMAELAKEEHRRRLEQRAKTHKTTVVAV